MDDRKTTLYLAVLCIILVIWGSVLDGKRKKVQEVLEAENAQLMTLVDKTREHYKEATSKQAELARKLRGLQRELKIFKEKTRELKKLNKELKAQLEKATILRQEAEKKAAQAVKEAAEAKLKASVPQPAVQRAPACDDDQSFRIRELEKKLDRLIRERDEMRSQKEKDQSSVAPSISLVDLQSQLRFCREQVRGLREDTRELQDLRARVRELERQLASRTQELWDTRLSLSADLDTCTRRLMEASAKVERPPVQPAPPPCMAKMEQAEKAMGKAEKPCAKKPCMMGGGPQGQNPRLKAMEAMLKACSSRIEALEKELHDTNVRHLAEIEELKRALAAKGPPVLDQAKEEKSAPPAVIDQRIIKEKDAEIQRLKAEISKKDAEIAHFKKNTEALLQQIRKQRAEIKRLKAASHTS